MMTEGPAFLRDAALGYLARFAATAQGLGRFLDRALDRWARAAIREGMEEEAVLAALESLRPQARAVIGEMTRLGALDDAAFARDRARGLTRAGRSRRAVTAHLMQRGVEADVLAGALDETLGARGDEEAREREIGAALVLARKRRIGPFRAEGAVPPDEAEREKSLAVFARHGFSRSVAEMALAMDPGEAEERVVTLRFL